MTTTLLGFAILWLAMTLVFFVAMRRAPLGYQDENGFHLDRSPGK